jgi:hypothetical protein
LQRPVVAKFTPLPEPAETDVAQGNKMKGIVSPDVEPTLADINVAKVKQTQSAPAVSSAPDKAAVYASPVYSAQQ